MPSPDTASADVLLRGEAVASAWGLAAPHLQAAARAIRAAHPGAGDELMAVVLMIGMRAAAQAASYRPGFAELANAVWAFDAAFPWRLRSLD